MLSITLKSEFDPRLSNQPETPANSSDCQPKCVGGVLPATQTGRCVAMAVCSASSEPAPRLPERGGKMQTAFDASTTARVRAAKAAATGKPRRTKDMALMTRALGSASRTDLSTPAAQPVTTLHPEAVSEAQSWATGNGDPCREPTTATQTPEKGDGSMGILYYTTIQNASVFGTIMLCWIGLFAVYFFGLGLDARADGKGAGLGLGCKKIFIVEVVGCIRGWGFGMAVIYLEQRKTRRFLACLTCELGARMAFEG
jgi:hypothetical protein